MDAANLIAVAAENKTTLRRLNDGELMATAQRLQMLLTEVDYLQSCLAAKVAPASTGETSCPV